MKNGKKFEDEENYTVFGENGKWWEYDKNEKLIRSYKDAEQRECKNNSKEELTEEEELELKEESLKNKLGLHNYSEILKEADNIGEDIINRLVFPNVEKLLNDLDIDELRDKTDEYICKTYIDQLAVYIQSYTFSELYPLGAFEDTMKTYCSVKDKMTEREKDILDLYAITSDFTGYLWQDDPIDDLIYHYFHKELNNRYMKLID